MEDIFKTIIPVIVVHAFVLALIILVIKRLLLNDTMKAVERIRDVEKEVRKREEAIRRQISEHEQEFAQKKAEAEEALDDQRRKSEKEVAKMRDQVIAEARAEADKVIDQAKANEEQFRKQIAQNMEEKAVEYGGQIFSLVFSERIGEELNRAFIQELLDALQEMDTTGITIDAGDTEFTCSHPMIPEQRKRLAELLKDKFGSEIPVQENVKPEILAGLIMKLGSLEIDGSLLNRYREATEEVKKSAKA